MPMLRAKHAAATPRSIRFTMATLQPVFGMIMRTTRKKQASCERFSVAGESTLPREGLRGPPCGGGEPRPEVADALQNHVGERRQIRLLARPAQHTNSGARAGAPRHMEVMRVVADHGDLARLR